MRVELVVPLFLQLVSKQAGIGPLIKLLALLLRHTFSVTANVISVPCMIIWDVQR